MVIRFWDLQEDHRNSAVDPSTDPKIPALGMGAEIFSTVSVAIDNISAVGVFTVSALCRILLGFQPVLRPRNTLLTISLQQIVYTLNDTAATLHWNSYRLHMRHTGTFFEIAGELPPVC